MLSVLLMYSLSRSNSLSGVEYCPFIWNGTVSAKMVKIVLTMLVTVTVSITMAMTLPEGRQLRELSKLEHEFCSNGFSRLLRFYRTFPKVFVTTPIDLSRARSVGWSVAESVS